MDTIRKKENEKDRKMKIQRKTWKNKARKRLENKVGEEKGMNLKKIRTEPVKLILIVLFAIQFLLIAHSNITLIDKNIDCDSAKLFTHTEEIWRQKTFLLPEWEYLTTLEWDCSSILALPFYAVTNDIILSFGLANIAFVGIFAAIIFYLFRGKDSLYPLFCINLLIIPYRLGMLDYYNMLFFGGAQYIIKASVPLLLVGILLGTERNPAGRKPSISALTVIYLGTLFLTSASSGFYVFLCGIFPVFAAYGIYKFIKWERVSWRLLCMGAASGILTLAGGIVNERLMGGARGNGMLICSVYQLWDNISSCFFGMFELFGGMTTSSDTAVLSMAGIKLLSRYCLVLVMLFCGAAAVISTVRKLKMSKRATGEGTAAKFSLDDLRILLLTAVFIWNLFILIPTNTRAGSATYEYRYHLIGMIPLMCITGILLTDGVRSFTKRQQNCLYALGILAVSFVCVTAYRDLYCRGEQNPELKEFCSYVKNLDADYIYMYNDSSSTEICKVLDETSEYVYLLESGVTWAFDYYNHLIDAPMQTENTIVAVNNYAYDFGDTFEIAGHTLQKFDTASNRSLYKFIN